MAETVISANSKESFFQYCLDFWNYRDLFRAFIERDLKVRYKQTLLGVLWVIIPPLLQCGIFYVIFVWVVQMPTQGLNPMLFFLAAVIPWNCFANGLSQAASSLEGNAGLIGKIYFPRMIIPLATIVTSVVDFAIGWIFFNGVAVWLQCWTWMFVPFTIILLGLQVGASMGLGMMLSVLNAQYRDIRYAIPFLVQLGMWTTPVIWPMSRLLETRYGEALSIFLYVNPVAGVIESYRALLLGTYVPYELLIGNFITTIFLLVFGVIIFRRLEQKIIDLL